MCVFERHYNSEGHNLYFDLPPVVDSLITRNTHIPRFHGDHYHKNIYLVSEMLSESVGGYFRLRLFSESVTVQYIIAAYYYRDPFMGNISF